MAVNMICVLILVVALVRVCQCDADNSSAAGEAAVWRRSGGGGEAARAQAAAAALRRQLVRDNYDYQNTRTDDDARHTQKDASYNEHVLRTNDNVDQPEELEEPEEQQDDEERDQLDELEERHEPNDAPESQDMEEPRDSQYDVPDGVDPADTHDMREPFDNVRDAIETDRRDNADPIYYSKRSDAHHPGYALDEIQVAPVSLTRSRTDEPDYELRRPQVTRTNKLRPYEPRVHGPLPPPPPPPPRGHSVSKKDLYYYVDDERLRRNNDVSADLSLTDTGNMNQAVESEPGVSKLRRAGRTERLPPRSQLVTVSASNVTYKLLTVKSREGRRSAARRFVEERGAAGVALVSLDRAPVPALRLPRARRQYMRDALH